MRNVVIKNVDETNWKGIKAFFEKEPFKGVQGYRGNCKEVYGTHYVYYGYINGDFDLYTLAEVLEANAEIIEVNDEGIEILWKVGTVVESKIPTLEVKVTRDVLVSDLKFYGEVLVSNGTWAIGEECTHFVVDSFQHKQQPTRPKREEHWVYVSDVDPECKEKHRRLLHCICDDGVVCIMYGCEDKYLDNKKFETSTWNYYKEIPQLKEMTRSELEEQMNIKVID